MNRCLLTDVDQPRWMPSYVLESVLLEEILHLAPSHSHLRMYLYLQQHPLDHSRTNRPKCMSFRVIWGLILKGEEKVCTGYCLVVGIEAEE
jgi:hypothetical protein